MTFRPFLAFCAFSVVLSATANASIILLDSQPGLLTSRPDVTVAITPHPLWQSNNPVNPLDSLDTSAVWISYALTGYQDPDFQPFNDHDPVVSIFQSFTSGAGFLRLNVWADDTAEVLLDGVSVYAPAFTQSICSGQPIGCLPVDVGEINTAFAAGTHQVEFRLFQIGTGDNTENNPFGLLYTGGAYSSGGITPNETPTPEPGTFALAGGILAAALGMKKKWSRRESSPLA